MPAGWKMPSELRMAMMKRHVHMFERLSPEQKAAFEQEAEVMHQRKAQELNKEMQHHSDVLHMLRPTPTQAPCA